MASLLPSITLVLGGQRSGKSRYAESLIEAAGGGVYLATAEALDDEMDVRIRAHQERRGGAWTTVEEALELLAALEAHAAPDRPVLVDCLTLWITNLMGAGRDVSFEVARLAEGLQSLAGPVVFVSNEVGLGGVAMNAMARAFADHAGRTHQEIALRAQRVVMITAGLPQILKDEA